MARGSDGNILFVEVKTYIHELFDRKLSRRRDPRACCGFELDRRHAWRVRFTCCCSRIAVPQRTGKGSRGEHWARIDAMHEHRTDRCLCFIADLEDLLYHGPDRTEGAAEAASEGRPTVSLRRR
jgi:hypothetical protein